MTDEAKALVERMGLTLGEWLVDEAPNDWWEYQRDHMKARDLIETQAREIERLRGALEGLLHMWSSRTVEAARAALAGDSHDQ